MDEFERGRWMQLVSGEKFYIFDPKPSDIRIEDIAHSLSHICRFGGHTSHYYSVAQHSIYVSQCLPVELRPWGLLHDAAEAYIGDMIRPMKAAACMEDYRMAEDRILECVAEAFGLELPMPEEIAVADVRVLIAEAEDLMGDPEWGRVMALRAGNLTRFPKRIDPWSPNLARHEFMNAFTEIAWEI